ncbi:MAG TPA: nuclear transport factor 2 family protein [Terracidiphilus sp.]|jgi:ketosteroid isomerase-like protein|nr:nuclear transport factor 2 family protein [Terracidiphilus sp.]
MRLLFFIAIDAPDPLFHRLRIDRRNASGLLSVTPMPTTGFSAGTGRMRLTAVVCAAVLASGLAASAHAMPRGERHEVRHEIDHLEDHWREALLSNNVAAMDALLASDYMAITSSGTLQSKDETLAKLRTGAFHIKSLEITDRKVRFYGSTALVTSRAEISGATPEGDLNGSFRYTRVYVRDPGGTWRIVSFEASRIRDEGDHK